MSISKLVQYPMPCPKCLKYTSRLAQDLLSEKKFTCRVCGHTSSISTQQIQAVKRTLSHLEDCGISQEDEDSQGNDYDSKMELLESENA
ncbi:MAG: hypothetical protein P1U57_03005 [Oleibacter sp.]|nr:hypothetical protein [Thalassolituus sp.]